MLGPFSGRWIRSVECHNLCRLINAKKQSLQPAELAKPVVQIIASFLKPSDVIAACNSDFGAWGIIDFLSSDTLERIGRWDLGTLECSEADSVQCRHCYLSDGSDSSDDELCSECDGRGKIQVRCVESEEVRTLNQTLDGTILLGTVGKGHGKGTMWTPNYAGALCKIQCYDLEYSNLIGKYTVDHGTLRSIGCVAVAPSSDLIATVGRDGNRLEMFRASTNNSSDSFERSTLHVNAHVESLSFCRNGNLIAHVHGAGRCDSIILVGTTPLQVVSKTSFPDKVHAMQVGHRHGQECVYAQIGSKFCALSTENLASLAGAGPFDWARKCLLAPTMSTLAVGYGNEIRLLHAGNFSSITHETFGSGYYARMEHLAFIRSNSMIVADIRAESGGMFLLRASDLGVVRHVQFHGRFQYDFLAVVPWHLSSYYLKSVSSAAQCSSGSEPEACATAKGGKGKGLGAHHESSLLQAESINIQHLEHDEAPSCITPAEAACSSNELWASGVEALISGRPREVARKRREKVLLTFSRSTPLLDQALLASSPAQVAISNGVDVQPAWAHPAKIFVEDVGPEHVEPPFLDTMASMSSQVVLYEDDVDDLLEEIKHLSYSFRKVKPSLAGPVLPEEASLFGISSCEGSVAASSAGIPVEENGAAASKETPPLPVLEVMIRRTFIDFPDAPSDHRAAQSAPF